MLNNYRRQIITGLIFTIILTCSGCWDRRELKSLAIVSGIALDRAPETNQIQVTAQILNVAKMSSGGEGKGGGESYINVSAQGSTVYEALLQCTHKISRQLFYPHSQIILISEELAREGIGDYLDFFLRDSEIRDTIWVMVTKGKAIDMLNASSTIEQTPSQDMAQMATTRTLTSESSAVNLFELSKRATNKTSAPLSSYIEKTPDKQRAGIKLTGTAVFNRKLQMVGTLSKRETRGLLWAINQANRGVLIIKTPGSTDYTSMDILRSQCRIKPKITDGRLQMELKVQCISNVTGTMGNLDMNSPEVWKSLQRREETVIYNDIMMAIAKSRQLNVDIFGFGDLVYKRYPGQWKQMQANWQDIFNTLDIQVSVNAELRRSGLLRSPIRTD